MSRSRQLILALSLLLATSVSAQQSPYVPEELRPWQSWVLQDFAYRECPFFFDRTLAAEQDFLCTWPGRLTLDVSGAGASFGQRWTVTAEGAWIPLPGDETYWPEGVTVDGRAASVVSRNGVPSVFLQPGTYALAGRINWDARPRQLPVAAAIGLLQLRVDGKSVAFPQRTPAALWISDAPEVEREQNRLTVEVYRLLEDGIPGMLTTALKITVSGEIREETLGPVLPPDFVPVAMRGDLPARLGADGKLRLQLRPGVWRTEIRARAPAVIAQLSVTDPGDLMPASETWSFRSADKLRIAVPSGPEPVDPGQAGVPDSWRNLPAFHMTPGQALQLEERSRGDIAVDNRLTLDRRLWLDFSGDGFSFVDSIAGTMRSGWRLDMAAPYALLNASINADNLLITEGGEPGLAGVEIRDANLSMQAMGRTETRAAVPATGWQERFDQVRAQLELPPGHLLVAAFGADSAPGAWLNRWQLLDFFLLLIVTIATHRLFGWKIATLAFATLLISLHEPGAPRWAWLNLLAAIALLRAVPKGRFQKSVSAYRLASLALLVLMAIPFLVEQVRIGLYPQLEGATFGAVQRSALHDEYMDMALERSQPRALQTVGGVTEADEEKLSVLVAAPPRRELLPRYAPDALLQTGPGKPEWQWKTYWLQWAGPVDADRTLNLVILSPWLVTLLRFVVVALVLGFLGRMIIELSGRKPTWPVLRPGSKAACAWPLLLLVAGLFAVPSNTQAEVPPREVLDELRQRLLEPPPCAPRCAEIAAATVVAGENSLRIEFEASAIETIALALPGSENGWRPADVVIDGRAAQAIYRDQGRRLWVLLGKGQHRVVLSGPLPPVDTLELPFPVPPRIIEAQVKGWSVSGISEKRLVSGSLQFVRQQQQAGTESPAEWQSDRFPVFASVQRSLDVGMDWTVRTTVRRVAPEQGAFSLEIPLLPGESVTSEGFDVRDGRIRVDFSDNGTSVTWQSTLPRSAAMAITAPGEEVPWTEEWVVRVADEWHADFSGIPRSVSEFRASGYHTYFNPRPDEALSISISRPQAVAGRTLAFDDVRIDSDVAAHSRNVRLSLTYRSTQGGQHVIGLPDGAEVEGVEIDGVPEPLRAIDGALSLPILPGSHHINVRWRDNAPVAWRVQTPEPNLNAAASNIHMSAQLPPNRWILGTQGPRLGPAVLYWPELAALVLLALILGRIKLTPLATWQWVLLGLGFSTFSWSALFIVVAWLLALGWRGRWAGTDNATNFNLVQVGIGLLTVAALLSFISSLPLGLLGSPDMHITGNGSYGSTLQWFADRSDTLLPQASVFSAPLWVYKALILAWALWVSLALVKWLPWGWQCLSSGALWKAPVARARSAEGKDE